MLTHLITLLDHNSVSFCHYDNNSTENKMIPLSTLQAGIMFALKHNLHIQYVLPPQQLPEEYISVLNSYPHDCIGPIEQQDVSEVVVIEGSINLSHSLNKLTSAKRYILRISIQDFIENVALLKEAFSHGISLNIVYTDVESFSDKIICEYQQTLQQLSDYIGDLIIAGVNVNSNIITDRIVLQEMNNCGAGETSITLAPDGKLYPCPGFYFTKELNSHSTTIESAVFPNNRLFSLNYAPLCKRCDAFHCKRCICLNKKLTYEVNIPSHQQCVMSHIERNTSKQLLTKLNTKNILNGISIASINYLDPLDVYHKS